MNIKINLPDGRETTIDEIIQFLYNLSKTDIDVLNVLASSGKPITTEEIAEKLNVTKASVSKALNNLIYKGLVQRRKAISEEKKKGRPNYEYWIVKEELLEKIKKDLENILNQIKSEIAAEAKAISA
ncbi:MAG: MarR family transcriptional regulator [Sulfolobaceae archaeon]